MNRKTNVLVFSIALNGYQWLYRPLFQSHEKYANKYSYHYQLVSRPLDSLLGMEVAWLKLSLIKSAIKVGYDWIVFLDADTEVSVHAPCIETIYQPKKSVYMAEGYSGEVNSGVMIVKNTEEALRFIEKIISVSCEDVEEKSIVPWGENGYVIHVTKTSQDVHVLDKKWNNNESTRMVDFIRHYSAGPLRNSFRATYSNRILYEVSHYWLAFKKRLFGKMKFSDEISFRRELDRLHDQVLKKYPVFSGNYA